MRCRTCDLTAYSVVPQRLRYRVLAKPRVKEAHFLMFLLQCWMMNEVQNAGDSECDAQLSEPFEDVAIVVVVIYRSVTWRWCAARPATCLSALKAALTECSTRLYAYTILLGIIATDGCTYRRAGV
jgi:hypothetical protein